MPNICHILLQNIVSQMNPCSYANIFMHIKYSMCRYQGKVKLEELKQAEVSSKALEEYTFCLHRYHIIRPTNKGWQWNPIEPCQGDVCQISTGKMTKRSPLFLIMSGAILRTARSSGKTHNCQS